MKKPCLAGLFHGAFHDTHHGGGRDDLVEAFVMAFMAPP
jgi:hypothetical protein